MLSKVPARRVLLTLGASAFGRGNASRRVKSRPAQPFAVPLRVESTPIAHFNLCSNPPQLPHHCRIAPTSVTSLLELRVSHRGELFQQCARLLQDTRLLEWTL